MGLRQAFFPDGDIAVQEGDTQFGHVFAVHRSRCIRHDMDGLLDPPPAKGVDLCAQIIDGPADHIADGGEIPPHLVSVRGMQMDLEILPVPQDDDAFPNGGQPFGGPFVVTAHMEHRIHTVPRLLLLLKNRRNPEMIPEYLRDGPVTITVSHQRVEKSVQEDEDPQGARIDDAGRLEPGEELRRGEDGLFELPEDPFPPQAIVCRRRFLHRLNQGVEHRKHRSGLGIAHRLPGPVPTLPDRTGKMVDRIGHEEAGEEPGGDVSRISPGRKEKLADDFFPAEGDLAQWRKADDEVPARVAVGDGKNVDVVQKIRPGSDTLDTGDKGPCKKRLHFRTPGPG